MPYDQFVRTQLTGYRTTERTEISSLGFRTQVEPRPDDMFALGFLSRGAVLRDGKDLQELAITATETVSTAFMGLTVGCAKCHDHMYDPITQRDFYAMKALFDPLVVKKVTLASSPDLVAAGKAQAEAARERAKIEVPLAALVAPYKKKLYEERIAMLPPDVQAVIRKPEQERTIAERKIADDYYPVLRIDSDKFRPIMREEDRRKYDELVKQLGGMDRGGRGGMLPAFWTVEVDPIRSQQTSYILTSGDPERPEMSHPVRPGWPFAPAKIATQEFAADTSVPGARLAPNTIFSKGESKRSPTGSPRPTIRCWPAWPSIGSGNGISARDLRRHPVISAHWAARRRILRFWNGSPPSSRAADSA